MKKIPEAFANFPKEEISFKRKRKYTVYNRNTETQKQPVSYAKMKNYHKLKDHCHYREKH